MSKTEYKVVKNEGGVSASLINAETNAEGGIFNYLMEGAVLVSDMFNAKHITADHAYDLFHQVIATRFPPDDFSQINEHNLIKVNIVAYALLQKTMNDLEKLKLADVVIDKAYLKMCSCETHGNICFTGGQSIRLECKAIARGVVDDLYEKTKINLLEKESLYNEIDSSPLPELDDEMLSHFN